MTVQSKNMRADATYDLVLIVATWIDERWRSIFDEIKAKAGKTLKHHRAAEWTWMTWENQVDRVKALDVKVLALEQAIIQLSERAQAWATKDRLNEVMDGWKAIYDCQQKEICEMEGRLQKLEEQAKGNEGLWRGHHDFHKTIVYLHEEMEKRIAKLEIHQSTSYEAFIKTFQDHEKRIAYLEDDAGARLSESDVART